MQAFIMAALPWVLAGLAIAILAVNQKQDKQQGSVIATGAALGLLLGVCLNSCGLWQDHALGLTIGPLWGMALASVWQDDKKEKTHREK